MWSPGDFIPPFFLRPSHLEQISRRSEQEQNFSLYKSWLSRCVWDTEGQGGLSSCTHAKKNGESRIKDGIKTARKWFLTSARRKKSLFLIVLWARGQPHTCGSFIGDQIVASHYTGWIKITYCYTCKCVTELIWNRRFKIINRGKKIRRAIESNKDLVSFFLHWWLFQLLKHWYLALGDNNFNCRIGSSAAGWGCSVKTWHWNGVSASDLPGSSNLSREATESTGPALPFHFLSSTGPAHFASTLGFHFLRSTSSPRPAQHWLSTVNSLPIKRRFSPSCPLEKYSRTAHLAVEMR